MKSDERWSDGASAGSWGDRGRRDGHHVEVESNECHTVRRLKDTEDRFNNHGGEEFDFSKVKHTLEDQE